jgi:hypothetical protein
MDICRTRVRAGTGRVPYRFMFTGNVQSSVGGVLHKCNTWAHMISAGLQSGSRGAPDRVIPVSLKGPDTGAMT